MTAYVRNRLAIALAAAMLLAPLGPVAWSQATGPIKIVVPYTPGSGPDILSRLMAEQIGRAQGPTVVVENRPGGGTVIGTEAVERAEPDGRTVLLVANSFVINPPLQRASYNPSTSFEPVCYLAATPMVLVVLGSSPYRTLNDLIAAARAKPTRVRKRGTRLLASHRHRGASWAITWPRSGPTIPQWYRSCSPARCAGS
jgi:tripartite-type tricarboxylate transporter receptor subunit TctC